MMLLVNNSVFFIIYCTEILLNKFCIVVYKTVNLSCPSEI